MSTPRKSIIVDFEIPTDSALQAAFGRVTMRHANLDYWLRLTIKTVSGIKLEEALAASAFTGSKRLRERILADAKKKLGDGDALRRLGALLERCRVATEKRNKLIHEPIVRKQDAQELRRFDGQGTRALPTVVELVTLERDLSQLVDELRQARNLGGFLAIAIACNARAAT